MNEKFENNIGSIIINDEGITYHFDSQNAILNKHIFFPYGSMSEIKLGLLNLSIKGGTYSVAYPYVSNQKQALKQLIPTLQKLNSNATKCQPVPIGKSESAPIGIVKSSEKKIEKNVESISSFFGGFDNQAWNDNVSNIVSSMNADEEILHGLSGTIMYINGGRESVVNYIGLITNRKFYYVGKEGKAILTYLKTGSVELKDVHAISTGAQTLGFPAYVQFEVKNDDYKLGTSNDTNLIKQKLEEGIKACENKISSSAVSQTAISSADELRKFKELLDCGIITQEEFDAKKKQLLGL